MPKFAIFSSVLIALFITSPTLAQAPPTNPPAFSQFYLTCLGSGGAPGVLVAANSGGTYDLILHGGETMRFSLVIAPSDMVTVRIAMTKEGETFQQFHTIPAGRSYSSTAKIVSVVQAQYPGAAKNVEYCFRNT